jgi:hypothetical protein
VATVVPVLIISCHVSLLDVALELIALAINGGQVIIGESPLLTGEEV